MSVRERERERWFRAMVVVSDSTTFQFKWPKIQMANRKKMKKTDETERKSNTQLGYPSPGLDRHCLIRLNQWRNERIKIDVCLLLHTFVMYFNVQAIQQLVSLRSSEFVQFF